MTFTLIEVVLCSGGQCLSGLPWNTQRASAITHACLPRVTGTHTLLTPAPGKLGAAGGGRPATAPPVNPNKRAMHRSLHRPSGKSCSLVPTIAFPRVEQGGKQEECGWRSGKRNPDVTR